MDHMQFTQGREAGSWERRGVWSDGSGSKPRLSPGTREEKEKEEEMTATSLAIQWLRRRGSIAGGMNLIPGQGAKIPHIVQCDQKPLKKERDDIISPPSIWSRLKKG